MSPNIFSVTMTSNASGLRTRRSAIASTYTRSVRTSGNLLGDLVKNAAEKTIEGSTRTASRVTSTPMPSPGRTARLKVVGITAGEVWR